MISRALGTWPYPEYALSFFSCHSGFLSDEFPNYLDVLVRLCNMRNVTSAWERHRIYVGQRAGELCNDWCKCRRALVAGREEHGRGECLDPCEIEGQPLPGLPLRMSTAENWRKVSAVPSAVPLSAANFSSFAPRTRAQMSAMVASTLPTVRPLMITVAPSRAMGGGDLFADAAGGGGDKGEFVIKEKIHGTTPSKRKSFYLRHRASLKLAFHVHRLCVHELFDAVAAELSAIAGFFDPAKR